MVDVDLQDTSYSKCLDRHRHLSRGTLVCALLYSMVAVADHVVLLTCAPGQVWVGGSLLMIGRLGVCIIGLAFC